MAAIIGSSIWMVSHSRPVTICMRSLMYHFV
jgi:hypothetical protein